MTNHIFSIILALCSAKTQTSLDTHAVSSESALFILWVAKGSSFPQADSEDSDQTGWITKLF